MSSLTIACGAGIHEELVNGVTQTTANNIIVILGNNNIEASRSQQKDGTYTILVNPKQKLEALNLLNANGQPQRDFASLGDIFKKDSFISSPLEEHSRFLYALNQEVSNLLASIDGVTEVKTIVNIPEPNDNLWQPEPPKSSASVVIKYKQGARVDLYINRIKLLVSNSVPGLTPERVEVVSLLQKDG